MSYRQHWKINSLLHYLFNGYISYHDKVPWYGNFITLVDCNIHFHHTEMLANGSDS